MNVFELAAGFPARPSGGVPEWMLGHFRRRFITFADGRSDERTEVHWVQSRTFTIDLRLPAGPPLPARPLAHYDADSLRVLANHEGWMADTLWQDGQLSWRGGVSLQVHNRWPEPAPLQRVGNCMIEFAPSGAYVEDWRLQATGGPLIGLRLIEERDVASGVVRQRGGGLIVCGDHAAWTHGRARILDLPPGQTLRDRASLVCGDAAQLQPLFDFETSLAHGEVGKAYHVVLSTQPARVGQTLDLLGFDAPKGDRVRQRLSIDAGDGYRVEVVREYIIDVLAPDWQPDLSTPQSAEGAAWFESEFETLGRHLDRFF